MSVVLFLLSLGAAAVALLVPGITGVASAVAAAVLLSGAGIVDAQDRAARKIEAAIKAGSGNRA
jgi:hypothetical protein